VLQVRVIPAEGAIYPFQCTCRSGAYSPLSFRNLDLHAAHHTGSVGRVNLNLMNITIALLMTAPLDCRRCPTGAVCGGNLLPPRAQPGYGVLTGSDGNFAAGLQRQIMAGYDTFYPCAGEQRCSGGDLANCDCLGGRIVARTANGSTAFYYDAMRCNQGYLAHSPLCSLCEGPTYVNTLQECKSCDWPGVLYLVITVTVVLTWFPFFTYVSEHFESLGTGPGIELATLTRAVAALPTSRVRSFARADIIFGFLQFLGLYSEYSVEWPAGMQALFDALLFFNLDVDMMQLQCWNDLDWEALFYLQAFLVPLLQGLLLVAQLSVSFVLNLLTDLNRTTWLLRLGWRPRRDFSREAIIFSYAPQYILYMSAYYITGIQVSLKPLLCVGDEPQTYMKFAPQISCGEATHRRILFWGGVCDRRSHSGLGGIPRLC
jgi:hypothetical protein